MCRQINCRFRMEVLSYQGPTLQSNPAPRFVGGLVCRSTDGFFFLLVRVRGFQGGLFFFFLEAQVNHSVFVHRLLSFRRRRPVSVDSESVVSQSRYGIRLRECVQQFMTDSRTVRSALFEKIR
ncbi:hypothetical protein CEXT_6471 [Caerostris extrusa]|uniref:Uncharacterized protein n=1 Tax=Caerostris extrusa TaxID=172846 RepID=A0AAV4U4V8_CAEEX|nr:hypothetical protein CEXT_6471 [Caerostris extrusa]